MIKRKSFVLTIIFFFWVGYILISFGHTVLQTTNYKKEIDQSRLKQIDHLLSVAQTLVLTGSIDALKAHLDEAAELEFITYYCVKDNDSVLFEYSVNQYGGCAMTSDRRIASYGEAREYVHQIVKPIKVNGHLVSVGFATDFWNFFWQGQKQNVGFFIKDVLIITLFLGILVYLIMKDFLQLDRLLQAGGKGDISKIKARSKEAQTLIDSTRTLDRMNAEKSDLIHHLQNTVGLAIHSEIDNKTPHLALIPSAVVRIDLNGYTQIFLEKKEEHIVTVLNEYFSVTNDLIKRFNGEIYQIIGDEIIFVLKNQDPLMAVFCVRAIFEWAKELDKKIYNDYRHRFLLKASISYGSLRFVQLNNGYAFAGVPLIESVRMLGCVSDKSENTLIVKKDVFGSADWFMINPGLKVVDLKGFEDKSEIFEIKEFVSVGDFFSASLAIADEREQRKTMRALTLFRGQNDVTEALQILNWCLIDKKWNEIFFLVQHLKELKIGIKSAPIATQLFQVLSDHFQLINSKTKEYSFLNSLVLMTSSLVHPELWSVPWMNLMKNYLLCLEPRIVANSTEVLCHFGFDANEMQRILVNWKDNNRISANFLLAIMKKSISKPNVKTLIAWLESTNILFQVSALYVIEEVLRYYQVNDPVVFKTNTLLADCVTAADKLKSSDHPLVKARIERLQKVLVGKPESSAKSA